MQKSDIEQCIPHSGAMCLLDSIQTWNETTLTAVVTNQQNPAHPLCLDGQLPISVSIEYAAQAAAVHVSQRANTGVKQGVLASCNDLAYFCQDLSQIAGDLYILVEQQMADMSSYMYNFRVQHEGQVLASGRLLIKVVEP